MLVELVGPGDQAFGETQPDRELEVVSGRAHRDRERHRLLARAGDPDLHRLLGDESIRPAPGPGRVERDDLDVGHRTPHRRVGQAHALVVP